MLSPVQCGVPNSRLRYYLLARFNEAVSNPQTASPVGDIARDWPVTNSIASPAQKISDQSASSVADDAPITERISRELSVEGPVLPLGTYLEDVPVDYDYWKGFLVPHKFYRQFWVMDIVDGQSTRSCCFTKRYVLPVSMNELIFKLDL